MQDSSMFDAAEDRTPEASVDPDLRHICIRTFLKFGSLLVS